jgi:hypothetical protein
MSRGQMGSRQMADYKIPPDEEAVLALQRLAGGRVHEAAGLIQVYKFRCYMGDKEGALKAQREMWKLAVRIERERAA